MKQIALLCYDYLHEHRDIMWAILIACIALCGFGASQLQFHEDIADFLPTTVEQREQIAQMQSQDNATKIFILSDYKPALDSIISIAPWNIQTSFTPAEIKHQVNSYYANQRYYVSAEDTMRMEGVLSKENVFAAIHKRRTQLQLPLSGFFSSEISNDPLSLFPSFAEVNRSRFQNIVFGYIDSPYGSSETQQNAKLVDSLQVILDKIQAIYPEANIRLNGAPVIAVGNARQIKHDSLLAIAIAMVLIIILLWRSLNSIRSMMLILASTLFGVIFAFGVMGVVHPQMSLIVIGISSVIIGIAVNYPLHLLVHRQYTETMRQTIEEVISPLVIGNITTVGAFLTLLPLKSVALRDLGLFCACMLVGTILFSIFFLPHFQFYTPRFDAFSHSSRFLNMTSSLRPEDSKSLPWIILVLTVVFGWYSQYTSFDANLSHINYMTPQQRADIALFATKQTETNDTIWTAFWKNHSGQTISYIREAAAEYGFRDNAFEPFEKMITTPNNSTRSVNLLSAINDQLSIMFDYVGLACSFIVFLFLWLSFRRLKYAIVAFVPMVISWLWILGLMYIFGFQFNIINIILATFIFGQGDDYTIFITEGLIHQPMTNNQRLIQYKNSIILSALIMFIGIGALIVAKHPALHSLATITMLGMCCVVLMAYIVPPILYKYLNLK